MLTCGRRGKTNVLFVDFWKTCLPLVACPDEGYKFLIRSDVPWGRWAPKLQETLCHKTVSPAWFKCFLSSHRKGGMNYAGKFALWGLKITFWNCRGNAKSANSNLAETIVWPCWSRVWFPVPKIHRVFKRQIWLWAGFLAQLTSPAIRRQNMPQRYLQRCSGTIPLSTEKWKSDRPMVVSLWNCNSGTNGIFSDSSVPFVNSAWNLCTCSSMV